jgi:hypothetical protein
MFWFLILEWISISHLINIGFGFEFVNWENMATLCKEQEALRRLEFAAGDKTNKNIVWGTGTLFANFPNLLPLLRKVLVPQNFCSAFAFGSKKCGVRGFWWGCCACARCGDRRDK